MLIDRYIDPNPITDPWCEITNGQQEKTRPFRLWKRQMITFVKCQLFKSPKIIVQDEFSLMTQAFKFWMREIFTKTVMAKSDFPSATFYLAKKGPRTWKKQTL